MCKDTGAQQRKSQQEINEQLKQVQDSLEKANNIKAQADKEAEAAARYQYSGYQAPSQPAAQPVAQPKPRYAQTLFARRNG